MVSWFEIVGDRLFNVWGTAVNWLFGQLLANRSELAALGLNTRLEEVTPTIINICSQLRASPHVHKSGKKCAQKLAQHGAANGEPGTAGTSTLGNADEPHNRNMSRCIFL